jgi:hypothetical protein
MTGDDELVEESLFDERGVPLCLFIEGGGGGEIDVGGR